MLGQRRRQRTSIDPTVGCCLVGYMVALQYKDNRISLALFSLHSVPGVQGSGYGLGATDIV